MLTNALSRIEQTDHGFVALGDGFGYATGDHIHQFIEWDTDAQPPVVLSISWFNKTAVGMPIAPPIPEHLGRPE